MAASTLPQRLAECGKAMATAAVPALMTSGGIHVPMLIAGCARMAGTYLFRSFGLRLQAVVPGQPVLSVDATAHIPALLQTCASVLKNLGTTIASAPAGPLAEGKNKPQHDFLHTQRLLDPVFAPLKMQYALNDRQMAQAAAITTGLLIHGFAKHLEPDAGFGVAAVSFTEGSHTIPAPPGQTEALSQS